MNDGSGDRSFSGSGGNATEEDSMTIRLSVPFGAAAHTNVRDLRCQIEVQMLGSITTPHRLTRKGPEQQNLQVDHGLWLSTPLRRNMKIRKRPADQCRESQPPAHISIHEFMVRIDEI